MAKYGMAIDLKKCVGCGACALACKTENNTGYNQEDRNYNWADFLTFTEGSYGQGVSFKVFPVLCNHCTDAPCVENCPVTPKAMFKTDDGITMHNNDRCIGCRLCQVHCPYSDKSINQAEVQYSVISYNWGGKSANAFYDNKEAIIPNCTSNPKEIVTITGEVPPDKNNYSHPDYKAVRPSFVVEKCIFCDHRVKNGDNPFCVDSCPSGARVFGDLDDSQSEINSVISEGYTRLRNNKGDMLATAEAGTSPNVFYVGGFGIPTEAQGIEKTFEPLLVYPNPTSSVANVKFDLPAPSNVSISLIDFSGRKVKDVVTDEYKITGKHIFEINVSNLKTGTYIVRLVTNKNIQTAKLIVSR
ncbi:Respiratory arsentate reductase, FeS subunit (ArrB) [hydrothermal vent metagenome]|uniref:Respiratory arsentate reductase, FeS subunit (ArrB) n=1 Tax=hydrothermal vent metagenome TaxID=652676 RepID=A0A3B0U3V4_9ZZZZ